MRSMTIREYFPYLCTPVLILLRVIHKEMVMQMSPKNFAPKSTSISHCVGDKRMAEDSKGGKPA